MSLLNSRLARFARYERTPEAKRYHPSSGIGASRPRLGLLEGCSSPQDRLAAAEIFEEGISLDLLQGALILAAARRSFREATEPPLAPIRSLRYFLPLIEEIRATPIEPDYIRYLEQSLLRLARSTPNTAC